MVAGPTALDLVFPDEGEPTGHCHLVGAYIHDARLRRMKKALREAGLRVRLGDESPELCSIEIFRHHGTANSPGDIQRAQHDLVEATLQKLDVPYRRPSSGLTSAAEPRRTDGWTSEWHTHRAH